MRSVAFTLRRLLRALEDLGRREDCALAGGDGLVFLALQRDAEPLVARLVELVAQTPRLDPELQARGRALVESRRERRLRLVRQLEITRDEIGRLDEARSRARALRPAYAVRSARPASAAPAFAAVG